MAESKQEIRRKRSPGSPGMHDSTLLSKEKKSKPGFAHKRSPPGSPSIHGDARPSEKKRKSHPSKVVLSSSEIKKLPRSTLVAKWKEQDAYISFLHKKSRTGGEEARKLKDCETKLQESVKRENILNMKLATKHQEMQELLTQVHDLKQTQTQSHTNLRSVILDPAVNLVFSKMKEELKTAKEQLETAQNDLSAWKYTPESVAGKKLMAKCRLLIKENEELGKQLSQGKIAKLEAELALQKKYSEELSTLQNELCEYTLQLDEECEGLHSMVLQLKPAQSRDSEGESRRRKRHSEQHDSDSSKPSTS